MWFSDLVMVARFFLAQYTKIGKLPQNYQIDIKFHTAIKLPKFFNSEALKCTKIGISSFNLFKVSFG
jgi:hypothetical protein